VKVLKLSKVLKDWSGRLKSSGPLTENSNPAAMQRTQSRESLKIKDCLTTEVRN
jgi:hypothetical protein